MDATYKMQTRFAFPDETQETPLHRAARDGKHEEVEKMVRRDASGLNEKDEQGRTPLHCAAMSGHRYNRHSEQRPKTHLSFAIFSD